MNKIILMGRLVRDPEIRYSTGNNPTAVGHFSLAVDRRFKRFEEGEPNADFFSCTAFGKQAEFTEKYLRQGIKVVVTGRVHNNNYTTREGQKVYSVQVIVEEIEFAESKTANSGNTHTASRNPNPQTNQPSMPASDGFMNIPDATEEELPFN